MKAEVRRGSHLRGPSTKTWIRGGALSAAAGVGSSLTEYGDLGKWLTVLGVVAMVFGLHRFGRTGPDEVIHFELEPPRKKRKKRKAALAVAGDASEPSPGDR